MTTTPTPEPPNWVGMRAWPRGGGPDVIHGDRSLSSHPPIRTPPIHLAQTPHPPGSHFPRTGMDGIKQPHRQGSSALGPMMYLHVQVVAVR